VKTRFSGTGSATSQNWDMAVEPRVSEPCKWKFARDM
jgi:hypothetical protein